MCPMPRPRSKPRAPTCAASGAGRARSSRIGSSSREGGAGMKIVTRPYAEADRRRLVESGVHPLLARLFAARRIGSADQLDQDFSRLIPPSVLTNADRAARLLAD